MIFLLGFHTVISLVAIVVLFFAAGANASLSLALGAGVSLLNLAFLSLTWPRILAKKLVALSIAIIVFKFAILGWILYEVVTSQAYSLLWFAAGLALVIPSTIATSIKVTRHSPTKAET